MGRSFEELFPRCDVHCTTPPKWVSDGCAGGRGRINYIVHNLSLEIDALWRFLILKIASPFTETPNEK